MKDKVLNLLGLATRARKIVSGEDTVVDAMRQKKAKIVFVASDASEKTIDKFKTKCFYYNVELNLEFNSDELSKSIGKSRKILAIIDDGFYKSIKLSLGGTKYEGKRDN